MDAKRVKLHELAESPVFPPRSAGGQDAGQENGMVEGGTFDHSSAGTV